MRKVNFILLVILGANVFSIIYYREIRGLIELYFSSGLNSPEITPNDTRYQEQWHLQSNEGNITPRVSNAWSRTKGMSSITIGIVDSGVDMDHPDLQGHINAALGKDFGDDDNDPDDTVPSEVNGGGHGTHVAGIAAAVTDNNIGVAGVCWNATIVPIKAWSDDNLMSWDIDIDRPWDLIWAVEYANNVGCDIINMTW